MFRDYAPESGLFILNGTDSERKEIYFRLGKSEETNVTALWFMPEDLASKSAFPAL